MSANPINTTETAPGTYWTRANIGEATPDILSPMCWSVWEEPTTMCFLQTLHDFGVVSRSEVQFVADVGDVQRAVHRGAGELTHDRGPRRDVAARRQGPSQDRGSLFDGGDLDELFIGRIGEDL